MGRGLRRCGHVPECRGTPKDGDHTEEEAYVTVRSGREPGGVARQDNQYRYVVTTPVYRFQVMYPFWKF